MRFFNWPKFGRFSWGCSRTRPDDVVLVVAVAVIVLTIVVAVFGIVVVSGAVVVVMVLVVAVVGEVSAVIEADRCGGGQRRHLKIPISSIIEKSEVTTKQINANNNRNEDQMEKNQRE